MRHLVGISVLALSLVLAFGGGVFAQTEKKVENAAKGVEWVKTELFFGRNIPTGHEISEMEFADFLEEVVTKYFSKGLTVYDAYGQMKDSKGELQRQSTYVIIIVHEKTQENNNAIQEVINAYRKQFGMPEVMYLTTPIEAKFYTI